MPSHCGVRKYASFRGISDALHPGHSVSLPSDIVNMATIDTNSVTPVPDRVRDDGSGIQCFLDSRYRIKPGTGFAGMTIIGLFGCWSNKTQLTGDA